MSSVSDKPHVFCSDVLADASIYSGAESQINNIDHVYSVWSRQAINSSCSETTRPEEDAFPYFQETGFYSF